VALSKLLYLLKPPTSLPPTHFSHRWKRSHQISTASPSIKSTKAWPPTLTCRHVFLSPCGHKGRRPCAREAFYSSSMLVLSVSSSATPSQLFTALLVHLK
jgi:hypothetical protein